MKDFFFLVKLNKEEFRWRPKLNGLNFETLDETSLVSLEREFTEEEIFNELMQCNTDKTPGSDGLNMGYIQRF